MPTGGKLWRVAYRMYGKQKSLSLGPYPDATLAMARQRCDEARYLIETKSDPVAVRYGERRERAVEASNTFGDLAEELLAKKTKAGRSEKTITKLRWIIGLASAHIGNLPVATLTPQDILRAIEPVEASGRIETARRIRSVAGEVCRHAILKGKANSDPTLALKGAITSKAATPRAALLNPKKVGELLRAIRGYENPFVSRALQLTAGAQFEAAARAPRWHRFLEEVLPDSDVRDFVQRCAGYILSGLVDEEKLFVLIGTGANGKSVFANVMKGLLGDYAVTLPTEILVRNQHSNSEVNRGVARLVGAHLGVLNETPTGAMWDDSRTRLFPVASAFHLDSFTARVFIFFRHTSFWYSVTICPAPAMRPMDFGGA